MAIERYKIQILLSGKTQEEAEDLSANIINALIEKKQGPGFEFGYQQCILLDFDVNTDNIDLTKGLIKEVLNKNQISEDSLRIE